MWSFLFWKAAGERAISTFAQTALALVGTDLTGYLHIDYLQIAAISGIAAGLSVLKSVGASTSEGTPSLGNFEALK